MKARELMTANPECVTAEDTLQRAAQIMRDSDVGAVPVVESRESMRLTGLITDRDIAIRHVAEGHKAEDQVRAHMTSGKLRTVGPDDSADDVLNAMREGQVRRIPVVEGDRLVGIIAQADVATEGVGDRKVGETVEQISEGRGNR